MKILATDIGGTNSRFAGIEINGVSDLKMSEPVIFPTWSDSVESFDELLDYYSDNRPADSLSIQDCDALSIAIAGAVKDSRGVLPNIPWDIDLSVSRPTKHVFLLNDFVAQAYAYLDPEIFRRMRLVRPAPGTEVNSGPNSIAIVGAGTGLGYAAVKTAEGRRFIVGSEGGHSTFSFHGESERRIESLLMAKTGEDWVCGDDVITGSGIPVIHEALTGKSVSPAEALQPDSPSCDYYARFYARACRNYCLMMYPAEALVISGGIAAKNPHIFELESFVNEFNDCRSYSPLMERIPIYLNEDQALGLKGAAIHAWQQLATSSTE